MTAARTIRVIEPTDVLWRRIGAFLIDGSLAFVLAAVTTLAIAGFSPLTFVVVLVGWLAAFAGVQALTGATPGKHVVGLRVVTASGDRAGVRRNLIRSAAWVVDGFPYVVPLTAYAAAFGDRDGQRLGDRWAGTYVVDRRCVGQPPFGVAFPADGAAPYRVESRAAYLPPGPVNPLRRPPSALAEAELAAARRAGAEAGVTGARPVGAGSRHPGAASRPVGAEVTGVAPVHRGTWAVGDDVVGFAARPTFADAAAVLALPRPSGDLVLDPASGAYTRLDPDTGEWIVFDEDLRCWRPAAEPALVALPSSAPRRPTR